LTLQDVKFHWGPEQQQRFDKLKQHLMGDTILVYPNFSNLEKYPFVLLTDGARHGLGAVLVQKQEDGTERVIQYKARATTRVEASGSATQLELACLIQALTWFSSILRLAKFIIRTDHVALAHLKSLKHSTHGKLLRYAILLDSFDYTIEHAKGKQHLLPDALSRRPFSEEEKREAESSAVELDPLYLTAITDAYFEEIPSTVESRAKSTRVIFVATPKCSRSRLFNCRTSSNRELMRRASPIQWTPRRRSHNCHCQSLQQMKLHVTQRTFHQTLYFERHEQIISCHRTSRRLSAYVILMLRFFSI
jgi:hypothetical protein